VAKLIIFKSATYEIIWNKIFLLFSNSFYLWPSKTWHMWN
jgi:hypothetical protein